MNNDRWLDRWMPLITSRACGRPVLEIGCGWGWDTNILAAAGLSVIGIDISEESLEKAKLLVPTACLYQQDMQAEFPGSAKAFGVIVASLSMHYFPWTETVHLVSRISKALDTNGIFLFRVNSVKDEHCGSIGYPQIEPHYYLVNDKPKRFFDQLNVTELFSHGWRILGIEEQEIDRFEKPKQVWEVVLEKNA